MSGFIYFETQNLLVRPYTLQDVDGLAAVMENPQVHTYTKDRNNPWDRRRTEEYIQFFIQKNFQTLDCFHGAVIEKEAGKIIGLTGLNPYKENEPEIEWKLGVAYWNKGYATEALTAVIQKLFNDGFEVVNAEHHINNIASGKVMEKCGMKYTCNGKAQKKFNSDELCDVKWYEIKKEEV